MIYQTINIMLTKNISSKTIMLRSDLCEYSDTYFVVDRRTNVRVTANTDVNQKDAAFKKTTIGSCITKINNTLINYAEDLDMVIQKHNLLEYSHD